MGPADCPRCYPNRSNHSSMALARRVLLELKSPSPNNPVTGTQFHSPRMAKHTGTALIDPANACPKTCPHAVTNSRTRRRLAVTSPHEIRCHPGGQYRSEIGSFSVYYCTNDQATCYSTSGTLSMFHRFFSASNLLANMAKSSSGEDLDIVPSFRPFPSSSSVGGISGSLGVPSPPPIENFFSLSTEMTMSFSVFGVAS
jgi:hypothetical protein